MDRTQIDNDIVGLILVASLHSGASSGETDVAYFLMSCLGFKTDVTLKDITYRVETETIKKILDHIHELDDLIMDINPKLHKDIYDT
ncbi:MAG: hypothetical protein GQ570_15065 [Helicobacteraceae bacterium]|nr:hypothetical protein [Helicobacteraceae bacterium]